MTTARFARIVCLADVNNTPNSAAAEFQFLDSTDTPFSTAGWTVVPSSENDTPGNDYRALHAIDGATTGDFWHTLFDGAEPGHPHWLDIDFGASLDVRKVVFWARPSGSNGSPTRYQVYLRAAGSTDWEPYLHEPSVVGDFTYVSATSPTLGAIPTPNASGVQYVAARRKRNGAGDSTCTRPSGVDDGDYVVLWIWGLGSNDTPTLVDDAAGLTLLERRDNGADQFVAAYGGFVGSGDTSWGATTSAYTSLAACFYRNVDPTTPVAATADAAGSSDSPVAPTVTASAADSMLVVSTMGTASGFTGNSGCTLPAGMVLRVADLDSTIEVADELVASGATGTRTIVMGAASQAWLAVSLVLNPAAGGGGDQTISPSGAASTEAHGTQTVTRGQVNTAPSGTASAEAHGTARLDQFIGCTGIPTAEAHGGQTITRGAVSVLPTGVASLEQHGAPFVVPGSVSAAPSGLASAEAFGTAAVAVGATTLSPSGIATAEGHGGPTVTPGAVSVTPSGIAAAEAHGTAAIAPGAVSVLPSGIASVEAIGSHVVDLAGSLTIAAQGIASGEAHGSPAVVPGSVSIAPSGIATAEQHGTTTITLTLLASAIGSGEAAGNPSLALELLAQGLVSAEAIGAAAVLPGAVSVLPISIASAEAVAAGLIRLEVAVAGVPSAEAIGALALANTLIITPSGIVSLEGFGAHVVLPAGTTLQPIGIASGELVGVPFVDALIFVLASAGRTVHGKPRRRTVHGRARNRTATGQRR